MNLLNHILGEDGHKVHLRVDRRNLIRGGADIFAPGRYNTTWLAEIVVSFSKHRGHHLTLLQKSAVNHYWKQRIYDLEDKPPHTQYTILEKLTAYFHLFDAVFFFGSLNTRCDLKFSSQLDTTKNRNGETETNYQSKTICLIPFSSQKRAKITIYTATGLVSKRKILIHYLEILLHEMIHAFLNLWSCEYKPCRTAWERCGPGEHGFAFQDILFALQRAVNDGMLLNLGLELGGLTSLARELFDFGLSEGFVKGERLRSWWMKRKDLRRRLGEIRKIIG
ncbi:hypothetical protein EG329_000550 [Mollisiaceae sp. DMI_Dod_QoI]|nr:hypothetical protein EG329_000550 [Helotiales sp. DMI_Dod_QoI]